LRGIYLRPLQSGTGPIRRPGCRDLLWHGQTGTRTADRTGASALKKLRSPRPITVSAKGHKQTSRDVRVMSVIPLKADIHLRGLHVCLVPIADLARVRH
jgi:hypothetical protein